MKRFIAAILTALMVVASPVMTAFAYENQGTTQHMALPGIVSPMWDNTYSARASLSASGNSLTATGYVRAKSSGTYCSGTLYVEVWQNNRWQNIAVWSVTGKGKINTSMSCTGTRGKTYRCRLSVSVGGETVSATSSSVVVK